eukprot:1868395-Pyramimonas_sp.AAC.1
MAPIQKDIEDVTKRVSALETSSRPPSAKSGMTADFTTNAKLLQLEMEVQAMKQQHNTSAHPQRPGGVHSTNN